MITPTQIQALYAERSDAMERYAAQHIGDEAAEAVVLRAFEQVARSAERIEPEGLAAYAMTVLRSKITRYRRQREEVMPI